MSFSYACSASGLLDKREAVYLLIGTWYVRRRSFVYVEKP